MLNSLRLVVLASVVGAFVGFGPVSIALAQTRSTSAATAGAFHRLSVGNQKVARSLHQAQQTVSNATASPVKPLTLDELAARHLSGQPWTGIFKDLKARGLVNENSLGQVVRMYGNAAEESSTGSDGDAAHHGKGGK